MTPKLNGIDHVHLYVASREAAEDWFGKVLGFRRVEALTSWMANNGPLTLEDPTGKVHIALFVRDGQPPTSSIAFGTDAAGFLAWIKRLEALDLKLRLTDHKLAYSLYFNDPWDNLHEITTYDRDEVAAALG